MLIREQVSPEDLCNDLLLKCYFKVPKNPDLGSDAERVRREEQSRIDESVELDEAEATEKEGLLKQVITNRGAYKPCSEKAIFMFSYQVRHIVGCTATADG